MTIKEKPLIDAVSKLGALPAFLFVNAVFAGAFTIFMCAVFGVVVALFNVAGRGVVDAAPLYEAARWGAFFGVLLGGAILIGVMITATPDPDEAGGRLQFLCGGAFCAAALVAFDLFAHERLSAWLAAVGPIV